MGYVNWVLGVSVSGSRGTCGFGVSREVFTMTTAGYLVEGMTCGYCMGKVHEKVCSLSGVTKVAMDLVAGGQSPLIVTSGTRLGADAVRVAVESAGFGLLPPRGAEVHHHGDGLSTRQGDTHPDSQPMRSPMGGVSS